MDDMEVDPPHPAVSEPLIPLDRLRQRLARFGVGEEYLGMAAPGLVAFVKVSDSWERLPELVEALLPSDEEVREILEHSKGESKKVTNAAVGFHFRESMNWLQFVMFMGDPSGALKRLSKLSLGRGVCGVVWGNNDIAYRCRTCEHDPTCAICVPCFMNGDHKHHDYSIIYTGGGCCDCGDVTAWKRKGFCSKHKGAEQIKPLPEEFANSVGPVLDALFSIWKDKLICIETVGKEESRENEFVAARVKAANKLTVAVVEMVLQFCKYSESLLSFVSKRVVSLVGLLEVLVRAEGFLSKSVVKKLQEMLLKLLGEPNFKYEFAKAFLGYYPLVVQEVTKEGSDEAMKKYPLLSKFSVQILTVPTLTPQLVKEEDLLSMLLGCLENIFVHCAGHDGCLLVSKWGNLYETTIRVVEDIRFVLSHGVVSKYVNHERKDMLKTWMNLLGFLQGMSPLKRETGIHIEEEDEHMNLPFVLGHSIANIHGLLVEGAFSSGKETDDTLLHIFKAESDEGDSTRLSKVGRLSQESPLCGGLARNTACVSASSSSGGHSGSSYDLLPLPVKWLAYECLRAIDNWLEPDNTSDAVPSQISGSIPNKNFLSFKGTLAMLRNGKYIFGGLSSPSEDELLQCIDPLKMENFNNTELDSKVHMKAVDRRMGGGTSGESNILHRLSLSDWPHIAYDVSSQEISVHIPLHRFLSLLLQKALRQCFGESMMLDLTTDASILSSAVPNDFFGLLLDGCHPTGFSAFVMEHPLRNRVFFAEVHAGMWRKNGDAAIMSCEWYRSVRWAEQGLEHDLFLLQCCGALAPANDYVRRIVERFGLLEYISLNSECSNEYEPVLVQEMLVLLIQIVQERRFSGLTTAESLRRELVHKLAVGDATHSQLVKSLPRDLSKFDQLQEILDSVATYSNPSGFNQGTYSLRWTCWKELDLYFTRWNSRDLQVAEERFMRLFSSSALTTQLPRWTKVFMPLGGIANVATCEAALQIVRSVLFYAVYSKTKAHTPDGVLLSALHLLSLALDICFQQRESGSSAMCIGDIKTVLDFATEEIHVTRHHFKGAESLLSLLVSLMKMQRGREFVELGSCDFNVLIENVLKKFAELDLGCTRKLQQLAPGVVHISEPILGDSSESMEIAGSDSEKRKAKARERQAAILAKMKAEQSKFLSSMSSASDHVSLDVEESNSDVEQPSEDSLDDVCSLCHDQNSRSPISFLVLLQKSRLLSFTEKVPPSWDQLPQSEKEQGALTKKSTPRPVITLDPPGVSSSNFITQSDQTSTSVLSHHEESRDGVISNEMVEQDLYLSIWKELNENFQAPSFVVPLDEMSPALAVEGRPKSSKFILHEKFVADVESEAPANLSAFNNEIEMQTDDHSQNATAHDGFSPADCDGVYLSSCGHAVHQPCLDRYLSSLKERFVRRIAFEGGHIVNPDQGEFLCPVCRRLVNSVLPGALKGWKQPIISTVSTSQSEKGVSPVLATSNIEGSSIFFRTGLALLQSASNTIDKGVFLRTYQLQDKRMNPDLDSICRVLLKIYFLNSQDKLSGLSMVNFSMIIWDVLKYSLASIEIAARGGRAHLEPTCSNDILYQELKSATGFALSLLLKCAECLRSHNAAHMLRRFQGIQLFANSICSGVQIQRDFLFSLKSVDKGASHLDTQFCTRAADPILAHDAFSSLMWVLFCLPLPFLSCQDSFLPLVHVFYAVTVVQAILACHREGVDFEDNLIFDVSEVSGDFGWLKLYPMSGYVDQSCDARDAIRRLTFPFLRRCALLRKVLSASISAPFSNRDHTSCIDSVDDLHEIEELEKSFKIPQLNSLIRDTQLRSLAKHWLHHFQADNKVRLSNCFLPITPAVPFKLICLPSLYQDLLQRFIKQRCGDCNSVIDVPALCLLCGKLCSPNWKSCCRENGCQSHAMACGAGTGVFLLIKRTSILLQRCARQSPWPSLYLDAYGEEDIEMHRGKPLYLNVERYAALTHMVASHALDRSSKVLGQTTIGFLI